jgi:hypothetical protein
MTVQSRAVDRYINRAEPPVRELLTELRNLIKTAVPEARETLKWNMPVYAVTRNFCYLRVGQGYASLGFYDATALPDEKGLLEGTGKKVRHVKVRSRRDIHRRIFTRWLKIAAG